MKRLSGSDWGAGTTTLWIATLALVHSTSEHCVPVWCRSAHIRLIDPLWIVTGCVLNQRTNLPIVANIQPAELRRNAATVSLARRAIEPAHLLHTAFTCPWSGNARLLKSRHPFVPAAQHLICSSLNNNTLAALKSDHRWNAAGADKPTRLRIFIPDTGTNSLEWSSLKEAGSGVSASVPVSDVSAPACTNEVWPPQRPVRVAQKKEPSTMFFSNVQSIDRLTDYTAWRFWTMKQPNVCSTSATRSSAVKE